MKNVIISPHTDDAIFSLGSFITTLSNVTILSPFAGVPDDPQGKCKHTVLREEHKKACNVLGVEFVNGDFLDDVYDRAKTGDIFLWINKYIYRFDQVYVPLGTFHADHIFICDLFLKYFDFERMFFYQELPYRIAFPELSANLVKTICGDWNRITCSSSERKRDACLKYTSQNGGPVMAQVMDEERIYFK